MEHPAWGTSVNNPASPQVTLAVISFNQRNFIRQAVEAAFEQTYSPLEIILSDDGSSDGTGDIIREMADEYHGPHDVVVNCNASNEGVASHVNRLFARARGRLLVLAAGDDVSRSDRVAKLVGAWRNFTPRPLALHSAARLIDADGNVVGRYRSGIQGHENDVAKMIKHYRGALLLGATTAYDVELQKYYGALRANLPVEDVPLTIRAAMLGRVAYVNEAIVDYRIGIHGWLPHGGNTTTFEKYREIRRFKARIDDLMMEQVLTDAERHGVRRFIRMAAARKAETGYAATIALDGRLRIRRLISTIIAARRLLPSFLITGLFCSEGLERLYFRFSQKFLATRDTRVFQPKVVETSAQGEGRPAGKGG
jgi:glycosyltransferase involved in cell wall biosynthesis